MIRATIKNENGTYSSGLSYDQLLTIVGNLEDNGLLLRKVKEGDKCFVNQLNQKTDRFEPMMGIIVKVLSSKKEGVRYDVKLPNSVVIPGLAMFNYYYDRFEAADVYDSEVEAQKVADQLNSEREARIRERNFIKKLESLFHECAITKSIPKTEEEAKWFDEWLKTKQDYGVVGEIERRLYQQRDKLRWLSETIENKTAAQLAYDLLDLQSIRGPEKERAHCLNCLAHTMKWEGWKDIKEPDVSEYINLIRTALEPLLEALNY